MGEDRNRNHGAGHRREQVAPVSVMGEDRNAKQYIGPQLASEALHPSP